MSRVTFVGAGLIGSAFAEAEQRRGHDVCVWNRSPEKLEALRSKGLRTTADLADAVRGVDRIHLALSADEAVDAVVDVLLRLDAVTVPVVDHSTTSPAGTAARALRMQTAGISFFHAPVFMSPKACREGTGCMVGAGPEGVAGVLAPVLAAMTTDYWYLGAKSDAAAVMKLFGNAILIGISGAMADAFAVAKSGEMPSDQAFELFSHFDFAPSMKARGARMAAGDFATSFALAMARKDVGLMLGAASALPLAVLPGISARMDTLIGDGDGAADLAILARESCKRL